MTIWKYEESIRRIILEIKPDIQIDLVYCRY
jgi:hypothetical protein